LMLSVEQQATWSSGGPTMSHYLDEEKAWQRKSLE
jgi:hypothetical protein